MEECKEGNVANQAFHSQNLIPWMCCYDVALSTYQYTYIGSYSGNENIEI
jgi:hypothetical protein